MPDTATAIDAAAEPGAPAVGSQIPVRRIRFDYPPEELPKHFMGDDLIMNHVVAVLSSLFPEGEDYFVRSVRNYRDQITDPLLKAQVSAFIGQEAIHGREHRVFNERLQHLGYPTAMIDRFTGKRLKFDERVSPERFRLAVTAALEHYTATLAEVLLVDPEARARFGTDEVRSLLLWHAVEENEHKAVAFDVFQQVCGSHKLRTRIMTTVTIGFIGTVVAYTTYSLALDPAARNPKRLLASLANLRHSPWLNRQVVRRMRDYYRPDFHPNDHDTTELLAEWRERLFGAPGTLVDHLPAAS